MAYRQEHKVAEIVEKSGVLEGRVPWHPGMADEEQKTRTN
jgi:methylenetetrahydrofolate reductase (NADPH)